MRKKIVWLNGNHMLIETEHKTFNRQTDAITTGNVIGSTQISGYIRAYNETECNGFTNPRGHLQDFDLNGWRSMPQNVRDYVKAIAVNKSVILYEFHHYNGRRKFIHGYIVTDDKHHLFRKFYSNYSAKSKSVIDVCAEYVCD